MNKPFTQLLQMIPINYIGTTRLTPSPFAHWLQKIVGILFFTFLFFPGHTQDNWKVSTKGSPIMANWMLNSTTGWAVGNNIILKTTDGGSTWISQEIHNKLLYGIWGTDANNIWTVGNAGVILYSSNGGSTWVTQTSGTTNRLNSIWGSDANNIWAVGENGTILRSTNGGSSWNAQTSGTTNSLMDISGSDANNIWIASIGGLILKTSNGGNTWFSQSSGTTKALVSLWVSNANNVWAVGESGTILRSINGGNTWSSQTSGTTMLLGIWGSDVNNLWAVGWGGTILRSTNGGSTWSSATTGTLESFNSIWGSDANNVWAVGNDGMIFNTTNGGNSWITQKKGTSNFLYGAWGTSTNNILAVGDNGTIYKYNGSSWTIQTTNSTQKLNAIWGSDANNIWAVGDNGTILRSSNGGTTWTSQSSGTTRVLKGIWGSNANNIWVVGEFGTVLRSSNGGSTWTTQNLGTTGELNGIWGSDANNIWIVGSNSIVLRTTNGGSTWSNESAGFLDGLVSIWGSDANNIWIVGHNGKIFRRNSSLWSSQSSGTTQYLYGVRGIDSNNIWAVGDNGTILRTSNGGTSWTFETPDVITRNYGIFIVNNQGFIVGPSGLVLTKSTAPAPVITTTGTLTAFTACTGTASAQQNFTISGSNLTSNITVTAPAGFEVSTTSSSGFTNSVTLTQSGGGVVSTTIFVRMAATATGTPAGNITCTSGATTQNIGVSGTSNALPTITLGTINSVNTSASSFSLPYTAVTGSPNQYSITSGTPTAMPGFVAVSNATLSTSPISVTIPASAANTYNFNLSVRNTTTGCVSATVPVALTVEAPPVNAFITRWDLSKSTGSGATQLTFDVGTTGTVSYTWAEAAPGTATGSGTFTGTTATIIGLPSGGVIDLSINPTNFNRIYINNGTDRARLMEIKQWGTTAWSNFPRSFSGCSNMTLTATDVPNTAAVFSMSGMFMNCTSFNQALPANFNTANVTDMSFMFMGCTSYNQALPANLNTSKVTNMSYMFLGCTAYNQALPANLNTSSVTSMSNMFESCHAYNQALPANLNTSKVSNMSWIFRDCRAYNQALPANLNTAAVTNMSFMFSGCVAYNQALPANFNTAAVTDMSRMFLGCTVYNQPLPTNFNTAAVTDMRFMFSVATSYNQPFPVGFNTANVTNMQNMFSGATAFNQSLAGLQLNANVNLANFLDNSGLSISNYDATLTAFRNSNVTGRTMGATGLKYCVAEADRDNLVLVTASGGKGWTITDGGKFCPTITTTGTPTAFNACAGTASAQQSFTVSGINLTSNITVTAPTGFEVSTTSGSGFASSLTLTQSGGNVATTTLFVRMATTATGTPSGNVAVVSTGATTNVLVSGTVNASPTASIVVINNVGNSIIDLTSDGSTYLWSNGATAQDIAVVASGTYSVIITGLNSCTITQSVNVTVTPATAQTGDWLRQGTSTISTNSSNGRSIAMDDSSNVYIVGNFTGSVAFGTTTLVSGGDVDIFLAKYDATGVFQWARRAGGTTPDASWGIAVSGTAVYITGGFRVTANFNTPSASGSNEITSAGNADIFLAKYDNMGTFQWARRAGSNINFEQSYGVAVSGTAVYLTGVFNGTANFNTPSATGSNEITSAGGNDIFLAKYDATGAFQWARRAGGTGSDEGKGVAVSGTSVYITGYFNGTTNFNSTSATGTNEITSAGSTDIFLAKYDNMGTFQWARRAGGTGSDEGRGVAVSRTAVYITGNFSSTTNFNSPSATGTNEIVSAGGIDMFLSQFNDMGTFQWAKRAGGTGNDIGYGIGVSGTSVFVTGDFGGIANFNNPSATGSNQIISAGFNDISLARYDTTGAFQWAKRAGGTAVDNGFGVAASATAVYMTGLFIATANFNTPSAMGSNELRTLATGGETFLAKYVLTAATTLTLGTATNSTNCNGNGSIAFTSTGITAGIQTLSYTKNTVPATAPVTVAANGTFTLTGLGAGVYANFAIGTTTATGNTILTATPALSENVTTNITTGTVLVVAQQTVTASNGVSTANVTYRAGNSVTLLPGFQATGNTFQATIGTGSCN